MMQTIYQVDSFASQPFAGNPAAVCVLDEPAPDDWMKAVAGEMNLSETAFLVQVEDGFNLRWFTPVAEVELCGHATLASAHVLWETGRLRPDEGARFHTLSGLLTADLKDDWIAMNFPVTLDAPAAPPQDLYTALGLTPSYLGKNVFDYLVEVDDEEVVRSLKPDFALLRQVQVRGVIVTARASSPEYDFVSRWFGPAIGIDEDPVTGSSHSCLVPYWAARLGKDEMVAYQASARGGTLRVRLAGDRVILAGQATTVLVGELRA